jgi:hypothetical protein
LPKPIGLAVGSNLRPVDSFLLRFFHFVVPEGGIKAYGLKLEGGHLFPAFKLVKTAMPGHGRSRWVGWGLDGVVLGWFFGVFIDSPFAFVVGWFLDSEMNAMPFGGAAHHLLVSRKFDSIPTVHTTIPRKAHRLLRQYFTWRKSQ